MHIYYSGKKCPFGSVVQMIVKLTFNSKLLFALKLNKMASFLTRYKYLIEIAMYLHYF